MVTISDMNFSKFFSEQARKPSGIFGQVVMSAVFDIGNAFLNNFVSELLSVQSGDHVLDIGCGTGKLISNLSSQVNEGYFEGVDYSNKMVSKALKKNKKNIKIGKVKIIEGNFDQMPFKNSSFNKVSSVNTLYFWPQPEFTALKISNILKPGGLLVVAFEDIKQLEQRNLNKDIFHLYTADEVIDLLAKSGFSTDITLISKSKSNQVFHCVVAKTKHNPVQVTARARRV
jgi:ubiquinone/menaquinone biosynthesis C-methylase UbiE